MTHYEHVTWYEHVIHYEHATRYEHVIHYEHVARGSLCHQVSRLLMNGHIQGILFQTNNGKSEI